MAPQPSAQSMQQLLSLWAEAYGSQVGPHEPEEQFSTPPSSSSRDDNDDFMRQMSDLPDHKFQQLEDQTFKPLFVAVEGLSRRCRQIGDALAGRDEETVTVNLNERKSNQAQIDKSSKAPSSRHLSTPVAAPSGDQGMNLGI